MKKFEKNILFVSIISLVLAMIFSTITLFVGATNAIKVLKDDGVKTVFDLMEYTTKKLDDVTERGKIVVNDNGEEKVLIDFKDGIHVNTGKETVDIDKTGIHVNN
ncbi:MAG: hypothetical protein MJ108_09830 [Saccharofermentans sp.]|nr:hypothetical protein [Saccharofermentans sp.]